MPMPRRRSNYFFRSISSALQVTFPPDLLNVWMLEMDKRAHDDPTESGVYHEQSIKDLFRELSPAINEKTKDLIARLNVFLTCSA